MLDYFSHSFLNVEIRKEKKTNFPFFHTFMYNNKVKSAWISLSDIYSNAVHSSLHSFILHTMMIIIYWFLFLFTWAHIDSAKVCPSYGNAGNDDQENCFDQCQPDHDQCEMNTKCCFFRTKPCGYRCIIPKDNREKSGLCPSADSYQIDILWSMCDVRLCDVDDDCPDNEKCCTNTCQTKMCLRPTKQTRKKRSFDSLVI